MYMIKGRREQRVWWGTLFSWHQTNMVPCQVRQRLTLPCDYKDSIEQAMYNLKGLGTSLLARDTALHPKSNRLQSVLCGWHNCSPSDGLSRGDTSRACTKGLYIVAQWYYKRTSMPDLPNSPRRLVRIIILDQHLSPLPPLHCTSNLPRGHSTAQSSLMHPYGDANVQWCNLEFPATYFRVSISHHNAQNRFTPVKLHPSRSQPGKANPTVSHVSTSMILWPYLQPANQCEQFCRAWATRPNLFVYKLRTMTYFVLQMRDNDTTLFIS